jgi:precorrin-2 dehydrogenase/sirohydrochlorin ferrochelatase
VGFIEGAAAPDLISLRAARILAAADVLVCGEDGRALIANHGRREAERLTPNLADAPAIADLVAKGRWVAIVGAPADPALVAALQSLGVAVERLSAAMAS